MQQESGTDLTCTSTRRASKRSEQCPQQMAGSMAQCHLQQCYNPFPFQSQRPVARLPKAGVRPLGSVFLGAPPTSPASGKPTSLRLPNRHIRLRQTPQAAEILYELADIDAKTAATIASLLGPVLNIGQLLMIARIVLSWYPNINYGKLPWVLAVRPTEPILAPTRKVIPIVGGLDVTPIVWVALLSFINEILLGPQGILNLLQRKV